MSDRVPFATADQRDPDTIFGTEWSSGFNGLTYGTFEVPDESPDIILTRDIVVGLVWRVKQWTVDLNTTPLDDDPDSVDLLMSKNDGDSFPEITRERDIIPQAIDQLDVVWTSDPGEGGGYSMNIAAELVSFTPGDRDLYVTVRAIVSGIGEVKATSWDGTGFTFEGDYVPFVGADPEPYSFYAFPTEYWPFATSSGAAVYDTSSGAQINDPFS